METEKSKSVLDNIPVEDKAFPLSKPKASEPGKELPIVGACPQCGSPIYGKPSIQQGEQPESVFSCKCWRPPAGARAGMNVETK